MVGMRRSEVSVLRWTDIDDAADGDGVLVTRPLPADEAGGRDEGLSGS